MEILAGEPSVPFLVNGFDQRCLHLLVGGGFSKVAAEDRAAVYRCSGAFPVVIPLSENDRFLTLAATDGENNINLDCIVFGDPRLDLVPAKPDAK